MLRRAETTAVILSLRQSTTPPSCQFGKPDLGYRPPVSNFLAMSNLHSDRYRALVARLREARLHAGLTQVRVAELIGKPQSYVSKIEQCERRLDPIELVDLARLYKTPVSDLLAGLDEPEDEGRRGRARRQDRTNRGRRAKRL